MRNRPRTIPTPGVPCTRCGQIHPGCTGHRSSGGQPCKNKPLTGLTVCRYHGGGSAAAQAAGRRRAAEQAAAVEAARFVTRRDIHPAEALLELVQWTAGEVDYWRSRINDLDDQELAGMLVTRTEEGDDRGETTDLTTTEVAEHIYVRMLGKASDRLATYAAAALRAGVDERRVRLAEQQGALVAGVIQRILGALNLTAAQQDLIPTVVPRELRALTQPQEDQHG